MDIFDFLNGFSAISPLRSRMSKVIQTNDIKKMAADYINMSKEFDNINKDRMKTTILKAKQYDKQKFVELLAADYITISEEI